MVYGGIEARSIAYDGVSAALAVPESELRLFGKPESFRKRRMGVGLARGVDTAQARQRAGSVASAVKPLPPV